jgi:CheY-like chemotaxis protein
MQTAHKSIVAIVDDDERTLESLGDLLEAAGFVVRAYSSATALIHEHGLAGIDCLVSDIGMPDMNGLELRKIATMERPDLPVILITGRPKAAARFEPAIHTVEPAEALFNFKRCIGRDGVCKRFDGLRNVFEVNRSIGGPVPEVIQCSAAVVNDSSARAFDASLRV